MKTKSIFLRYNYTSLGTRIYYHEFSAREAGKKLIHPLKSSSKFEYSSPKEMQRFWSCLSFGEKCRSVKFGPNFIFTMLLVPICPKPHSKIPHRSCTVIRHLSTSQRWNFTKLDASSKFESCFSFWEECMLENLGLNNIFGNSPDNNMEKTPFKNSSSVSCNVKMFEWMSSRWKNHQIDKVQQLTETEFWSPFPNHLIFLSGVFCPLLSGPL